MISRIIAQKKLRTFFKKNRIACMDELFPLLETTSRMTVFRRLQECHYLSSFTHAGRYYTLTSIARFDTDGLWFCDDIGFSRFGSLKETVHQLVEKSSGGKKHHELETQLHVRVHNPLLELVRLNKISRQSFDKAYLYLNAHQGTADQQLACRKNNQTGCLDDVLSDAMVVEVLSEIIRSNQPAIDCHRTAVQLLKRGVSVTSAQCERLCRRLGLKKTPG